MADARHDTGGGSNDGIARDDVGATTTVPETHEEEPASTSAAGAAAGHNADDDNTWAGHPGAVQDFHTWAAQQRAATAAHVRQAVHGPAARNSNSSSPGASPYGAAGNMVPVQGSSTDIAARMFEHSRSPPEYVRARQQQQQHQKQQHQQQSRATTSHHPQRVAYTGRAEATPTRRARPASATQPRRSKQAQPRRSAASAQPSSRTRQRPSSAPAHGRRLHRRPSRRSATGRRLSRGYASSPNLTRHRRDPLITREGRHHSASAFFPTSPRLGQRPSSALTTRTAGSTSTAGRRSLDAQLRRFLGAHPKGQGGRPSSATAPPFGVMIGRLSSPIGPQYVSTLATAPRAVIGTSNRDKAGGGGGGGGDESAGTCGPGSYDAPDGMGRQPLSTHRSMPASSFPTASKLRQSRGVSPGPIYAPRNVSHKVLYRFPTSERQPVRAPTAPGPKYHTSKRLHATTVVKRAPSFGFGTAPRFGRKKRW